VKRFKWLGNSKSKIEKRPKVCYLSVTEGITMPFKKVHYSDAERAKEAYAVFIRRERASRSVTKAELQADLKKSEVYTDFLKLCAEHDGINDPECLSALKKGIYLVLQAIGIGQVEREMGVSRVTLYRMFSQAGNPSLSHLLKVLGFLKLRFWIVEEDFVARGNLFRRHKRALPDMDLIEHDRRKMRMRGGRAKGPKIWTYIEDK
jgi:DNA-binding phage protein